MAKPAKCLGAGVTESPAGTEAQAPIPVAGTEVLEEKLEPLKVDFDALERLHVDKELAGVLVS
jgi:hypothetical protein